ncbi:hypothetical protein [Enterobacter asburiae]|uniref:hypothetical protein n=1 Tax=Enterobacter asburiae TaxID=61645 RepID=UPI0021CB6043|nr:hypothetical protein [Enterobacter asburiae]
MSTITKEWLQQTIAELEEGRDAVPGAVNEDAAKALAAMKIALASLEAEPVGFIHPFTPFTFGKSSGAIFKEETRHYYKPVFTAPPAPITMKDHQIRELVNELRDIAVEYHGTQQLRERIARTCRAAMLQGAYGNSPVIPDGYALVPVEPTEDMIVNGFESEPDESFSDEKEWEAYDAMSGCQQAAHRAKLCWAAMIASAPKPEA